MIKLIIKIFALIMPWPAIYLSIHLKLTNDNLLIPTVGVMGLQLAASLLYALMYPDEETSIRPWKWFRWNLLLAGIIWPMYINAEWLSSPILTMFSWTLIIMAALSIIMLFVVKHLVHVDARLVADVKNASRYDDTRLIITLDVPFWLNYIPFNLGNVRIAMRYGIIGDRESFNTAHLTVKKDIKFEITFKYKGKFEVGVSRIGFADTLNLISMDGYYEGRIVKVYPKTAHLQYNKKFSMRGESEALATLVKSGDEHDIREYQHGDSFKKINWKIYSRQQKFYTKEPELTSFVSNRIIIYDNRLATTGHPQKYVEEKMTEALASVVKILHNRREEYKLFTFNKDGGLDNKQFKLQKMNKVIEDISFIEHIEEITNVQYLSLLKQLQRFSQQGEFIIICSNLDNYMRNLVMTIHSRREKIKFIYVDDAKVQSEHDPVEVCKHHNIPYVHLPTNAQIDSIEKDALK